MASSSEQKKKKQKQQLREVGEKLLHLSTYSTSKDALIKLLKQAATCLSVLDQSPSPSMLESMRPCLNAIAKPEFLKHQDRDVKLLVATCICEITRITAPEAPYSDDVLRDIFHLIVGTFSGLGDSNNPSFGRRVVILETLARYRSCVVMLDLDCHDLVNEMFATFFAVASDDHPETVLTSMQTIMTLLLEESEDIQESLLLTLLTVLGRAKSDVSMAARRLAMNVIGHCAVKLESCIKQFLISSMSGDNNSVKSQLDYHEVIYDTYCCAPQILAAVVPYLTGELLADQLGTRLKAVKLLGDLFSLPDPIFEAFQPIFSEFLKRLTDRVVEVRMSVVEHIKNCLLSNPLRVEAPQIIGCLCDRLLDYDENVRKHVVSALCDVACCALKSIAIETLRLVAERLRDKSPLVKRYTMERMAEIYKIYCMKCSDDSISTREFEWIPGKILRCFYDKDFRSETVEAVLCGSLFPMESTAKDKVKHWVTIFTGFDKVEVKALEKILEQKQRLQQEMQKYLSLRQMHQDGEASELEKKTLLSFRIMSSWFVDPAKAEENFHILDQLKDVIVWKILSNLLDPNTRFHQACAYRDDLLKILGERHPLYDFLGTLSMKCSYLLFDKECVKEILLEVATRKSAGETQFVLSCMNLLVILAHFSPTLLSGTEEDLVSFLKEDDEILKEGALHILARAGGTIREELAMASRSVDLVLERLCLEGSRKQAKYAVHALAAITKDDGLKSLSVLYKRLVDMLAEKTHLPAILQSLGCIAQIAMPIFETRESEVVGFITSNILECSNKVEDISKTSWNESSELCLLKIFGIKTLVKSYLPFKDAHLRLGIENFLAINKNILSIGEVSVNLESSSVDKAHMKLASAKSVLRLSKFWEHKIPIDVFHLTLRTSEINYPEARKQFLGKVHQYIKDKLLDVKYACTFLYTINGAQPPEFTEYKHILVEVMQMCFQAKARQHPMHCDANPLMTYPEYILPYLVHSVAHHSSFPNVQDCADVGAFETIYRQLHLFLSLLMHGGEDGKSDVNNSNEKESIPAIISIFQSIKCSEDTMDMEKSKNSHAVCDIGLSITKGLTQMHGDSVGSTLLVPLPLTLYKPSEKKGGDDSVTWLARDSVLSHFESLKLEPNGTVVEDEKVINDNNRDENDLPLGQLLKKYKSQGSKMKKIGKKKVLLAKTKNPENEIDILGMVREINLDRLQRSKSSELGNGHEYILGREASDQSDVERVMESGKRKRREIGELTSLASPEQNRSIPTENVHKSFRPGSYLKGMVDASKKCSHQTELPSNQSNEREDEARVDSTDKVMEEDLKPVETELLTSYLSKKSSSSKRKYKGTGHDLSDRTYLIEEAGDPNLKTPNAQLRDEKNISNSKFSNESVKKRKRRSIAGLAKCSSKEVENHNMVGCRIKVWWPLDKRFYEGLVQSYDRGMEKYEILYEDGDVELLHLDNERWELITNGQNPRKQLKSLRVSPSKGMSTEYKKNSSTPSSLRQKKSNKKSSSSEVRWKGTPKDSVEQNESRLLEDNMDTDSSEAESKGDSERKQMEESAILIDLEDKKEKKLCAESKQVENERSKQQFSKDESEGVNETEKRFIHRGKQGEVNEKGSKEVKQAEKETPDYGDTEYTDDEPLSVWKHRASKGRRSV